MDLTAATPSRSALLVRSTLGRLVLVVGSIAVACAAPRGEGAPRVPPARVAEADAVAEAVAAADADAGAGTEAEAVANAGADAGAESVAVAVADPEAASVADAEADTAAPARLPDVSTLPGQIKVPLDRPVFVAHGPPGERRAIIYLHGKCGDPLAFRAWAGAATRVASVVSIQGDVKCPGGFRATWSHDVRALDRRVTEALAAVGAARGASLDGESLTVVGYSLGAARAEDLVRARPRRYRRALLVAGPTAPLPESFAGAGAVAVIAGGRDVRRHLREGAAALADEGVTARYVVLPGAKHGEYGPEGERVMGEALAWAFQQAP